MTFQSDLYEAGLGNVFEAYNSGKMSREDAEAALYAQQYKNSLGPSADEVMKNMMADMEAKYAELATRYKQYETTNPFTFDEMLARASAEERLGPYYKAELDDYIKGVERQRESIAAEGKLLTDLNTIAVGAEKRNLDEAVKASEEGYAGSGLYFSGERESATGLRKIAAEEATKQRETKLAYGMGNLQRSREATEAEEGTYRRKWGAEKETEMQTDIEEQKRQERAQWEVGRMESLGPEFMGRQIMSGGLESFLTNAYS